MSEYHRHSNFLQHTLSDMYLALSSCVECRMQILATNWSKGRLGRCSTARDIFHAVMVLIFIMRCTSNMDYEYWTCVSAWALVQMIIPEMYVVHISFMPKILTNKFQSYVKPSQTADLHIVLPIWKQLFASDNDWIGICYPLPPTPTTPTPSPHPHPPPTTTPPPTPTS